ncbi:hypothetical protein MFIFM68171_10620 [Madurella fahalii]|uniref:Uncharacterized protein n=1 Tax=Madurella fahalii TaxID=1157608 RepID=A0ABQ0GRQ3_9PEZI
MPHSVRSEDEDDIVHTSRLTSPAAPASAPTQAASTNGVGTTTASNNNNYPASAPSVAAAPAQSPPTTITFARVAIPAGGRNGGGVSLLSALLATPIAPAPQHSVNGRPGTPVDLVPFSAPSPAPAAEDQRRVSPSALSAPVAIPNAWRRDFLRGVPRPVGVPPRDAEERQRQRDQSVAFTAEEIAAEFEALHRAHQDRLSHERE